MELSVIEISNFSLILFYPTTQVRLLLSPFHAYLSYLFNSHFQLSKFKVILQSLPYLTILQNFHFFLDVFCSLDFQNALSLFFYLIDHVF